MRVWTTALQLFLAGSFICVSTLAWLDRGGDPGEYEDDQ